MSSPTKAKINLKEGIIELEGSEAFVAKYIDVFQKEMKQLNQIGTPIEETKSEVEDLKQDKKPKKGKTTSKSKPPVTVAPIPLDLKQSDNKPSLRAFVKDKAPKSFAEKLTVFAYYLKKYLDIQKMEAGHVVFCCKEVRSRVPRQINVMFYDIQRHKGWITAIEGRKYGVITTAGENYVEFDLPSKKDVTANKTTT